MPKVKNVLCLNAKGEPLIVLKGTYTPFTVDKNGSFLNYGFLISSSIYKSTAGVVNLEGGTLFKWKTSITLQIKKEIQWTNFSNLMFPGYFKSWCEYKRNNCNACKIYCVIFLSMTIIINMKNETANENIEYFF